LTALTCYRILDEIDGTPVADFDDILDQSAGRTTAIGPVSSRDFEAKLYVLQTMSHDPRWASLLKQGFPEAQIPRASSPGALLLIRISVRRKQEYYAFPFGIRGRHLIRSDAYVRGYGLRCALNIMYPRGADDFDPDRVRGIGTKIRGPKTIRARAQISEASVFEEFNVNKLRDVVDAAVGVPSGDKWGARIGGSDALSLGVDQSFDEFGRLCKQIGAAYRRDDYKDNFDWIDYIRPISDPGLREDLTDEVIRSLRDEAGGGLALAPPEVIEWEQVEHFHYHFDRPQGAARSPVRHGDLRLRDYLAGLNRTGRLEAVTVESLKSSPIEGRDPSGSVVQHWSVWRCLTGEIVHAGETYILDDGEFFTVSSGYLGELDGFVDGLEGTDRSFPTLPADTHEKTFNEQAALNDDQLILLDRQNVIPVPGRTTPIELCDLLSSERELIHVKRKFGSSDLSHLFSQGVVSAELLHHSSDFRTAATHRVNGISGNAPEFDFLSASVFDPRDYKVVYAVVGAWGSQAPSAVLPFFSKVNLREAVTNLMDRGFAVGLARVETA
jgi:uncharacterized protein (TIGR04141 family)